MAEIPETMSAVVATPDGPRWTERRDVPVPEPEDGEALVAVHAFAVNRGELALLASRGGWQPGQDVAGVVARAAADGSGPQLRTRVAGLAEMAGWAQYAVVPADRLAALPDGIGFDQAAALPMAGTTALNVVRAGGALLGRRVLVTGASGGVGGFAVQLAALAGARVSAVARSEHAPRLLQCGASEVVADVGETAAGVYDVVLESVGGTTLAAAFERIAPGGLLVAYGNSSREAAPFNFFAFSGRDDARVRTYFSSAHAHEAGAGLAALLDLMAAGRLHVELGVRDSWDRLDDALARLRDRRLAGKAVLTVG
jgi:NADPH2:quinone reductase